MMKQCLWDELQAKAAGLSLSCDDEGDTMKKKQKDNWLPMAALASTMSSPSSDTKQPTLWQKNTEANCYVDWMIPNMNITKSPHDVFYQIRSPRTCHHYNRKNNNRVKQSMSKCNMIGGRHAGWGALKDTSRQNQPVLR
jgi:hypothetical protein